jgi:hypothetical protein
MIRLALSEEEMVDIAEALDDPMLPENQKTKLLVLRMHKNETPRGKQRGIEFQNNLSWAERLFVCKFVQAG